jgi:hypothetical protein
MRFFLLLLNIFLFNITLSSLIEINKRPGNEKNFLKKKNNILEKIPLAVFVISGLSIPIQFAKNHNKAILEELLNASNQNEFYSFKKLVYEDANIKMIENITFFHEKPSISPFRKVFNNNILATFAIFVISAYISNSIQNKRLSTLEKKINLLHTKSKFKKNKIRNISPNLKRLEYVLRFIRNPLLRYSKANKLSNRIL